MENQAISVDLIATPDRTKIVVLFTCSEAIPMATLIESLGDFQKMLEAKFMNLNKPKIII